MHAFKEMVEKYTIKPERMLKKISAPLTECLSIPIFIYSRTEADGRFGHLSNYPENLDFFYSEQLFLDFPYFIHPHLLRGGVTMMSVANKATDIAKINARFHISHIFTILQHNGSSVEFYAFAIKNSDPNQNVDFFPKLHLLHTFIGYFKREYKTVIQNMMADGYNLIDVRGAAFFRADPALPLSNADAKMQQFLKAICPLSPRELQCLDLFKQGKSAQATAAILHLSQRTVEHYLEHIKEKLGCQSKWELLNW